MQPVVYLCVRTGPKHRTLPYRHTTLPQDVVILNEHAGLRTTLLQSGNLLQDRGQKPLECSTAVSLAYVPFLRVLRTRVAPEMAEHYEWNTHALFEPRMTNHTLPFCLSRTICLSFPKHDPHEVCQILVPHWTGLNPARPYRGSTRSMTWAAPRGRYAARSSAAKCGISVPLNDRRARRVVFFSGH
jgi:hypothetical protein